MLLLLLVAAALAGLNLMEGEPTSSGVSQLQAKGAVPLCMTMGVAP
jgi:hypothetical protein